MADKPLVFLLHGMGVHDVGWSEGVKTALDTHAQKYAFFNTKKNGKDIATLVDFEEITYDTIFQKALNNWDRKNSALLREVAPSDQEEAENAIDWLKGMGDKEDNFAWTHAVDVLLWRFSSFFRNTVKAEVAAVLTAKIVEKSKLSELRHVRAVLISHSLGTAVAHDVLADLAAGRFTTADTPINGFHPRSFRFASLHSIANVSRILELADYPVYASRVRPGAVGDEDSYCRHFYNYHNSFDPFTRPRPFEPDWQPKMYHDKAVSHLHDKNPHSIEHYLLNPKVHVPILRSIMGDARVVKSSEEVEAIEAFKDISIPGGQAKREALEKRIKDAIEAMGKSVDMIDLLKGIQLYFGSRS